ncbi:hypothetical protein GVAV_000956 [Gurleya vavrai]
MIKEIIVLFFLFHQQGIVTFKPKPLEITKNKCIFYDSYDINAFLELHHIRSILEKSLILDSEKLCKDYAFDGDMYFYVVNEPLLQRKKLILKILLQELDLKNVKISLKMHKNEEMSLPINRAITYAYIRNFLNFCIIYHNEILKRDKFRFNFLNIDFLNSIKKFIDSQYDILLINHHIDKNFIFENKNISVESLNNFFLKNITYSDIFKKCIKHFILSFFTSFYDYKIKIFHEHFLLEFFKKKFKEITEKKLRNINKFELLNYKQPTKKGNSSYFELKLFFYSPLSLNSYFISIVNLLRQKSECNVTELNIDLNYHFNFLYCIYSLFNKAFKKVRYYNIVDNTKTLLDGLELLFLNGLSFKDLYISFLNNFDIKINENFKDIKVNILYDFFIESEQLNYEFNEKTLVFLRFFPMTFLKTINKFCDLYHKILISQIINLLSCSEKTIFKLQKIRNKSYNENFLRYNTYKNHTLNINKKTENESEYNNEYIELFFKFETDSLENFR